MSLIINLILEIPSTNDRDIIFFPKCKYIYDSKVTEFKYVYSRIFFKLLSSLDVY